jgi:hypothetical protein
MKHLLLSALFVLLTWASLSAQVQVQARKMEIYELACTADLVVRGKISELEPLRFTLDITETLKGTYTDKTISVIRFINTKAAKRWGKYTVGEELLLFLRVDGNYYKILGENGEGEKLVMGSDICIDSRGIALKNRNGYQVTSTGANIYGELVPAKDLLDAVRALPGCYSVSYVERDGGMGKMEQFPVATSTCDDQRKDELRSMSWVHDIAISQAEKAIRGAK